MSTITGKQTGEEEIRGTAGGETPEPSSEHPFMSCLACREIDQSEKHQLVRLFLHPFVDPSSQLLTQLFMSPVN